MSNDETNWDDYPFPTSVGMNRQGDSSVVLNATVPHERGDEPAIEQLVEEIRRRSPRAWG